VFGSSIALVSEGLFDTGDDIAAAIVSGGFWAQPSEASVDLHCSAVTQASGGYSITLTAVKAVRLEKEIFVVQRKPNVSLGARNRFSHVASPTDLEEYSIGSPLSGSLFYRQASVTLVFRSLDRLMQYLQDIKRDICLLVETTNQNRNLTECEFVVDQDGASACLPV
jgi:hypothetical protein